MLYTFIMDDKVFISDVAPDVDFESALDNAFEAKFKGLIAEYAIVPIQNILRNGDAAVKSA